MNCPICNRPMEAGNLYGPSRTAHFFWLPEGETVRMLTTHPAIKDKNGIIFDEDYIHLAFPTLQTHICRCCGHGVFTFTPETSD